MIRNMLIALVLGAVAALPVGAQLPIGLTPSPEVEQTRVATRGANFLNLPIGARAQGLSGAYTAVASGIPALYWNTAATAFDDRTHVGASLSNMYDDLDIQHLFAGVILPMGMNRFGLSVNQLASGEMQRTDEDFPEGGNNQFGDSFEYTATAIGLHFSRLITDRLGMGFAAKYITEGIPGANVTFLAADMGIRFNTGVLGTTLAASLVNVGGDGRVEGAATRFRVNQSGSTANVLESRRTFEFGHQTRSVELPTAFRFGVSTELLGGASSLVAPSPDHSLLLMVDLSDGTDSPLSPTLGLEYNFRDIVFLRGGKRWANEDQISRSFGHLMSVGAGIVIPVAGSRQILFDYAFTDWGDLQNVQSFGFELAL